MNPELFCHFGRTETRSNISIDVFQIIETSGCEQAVHIFLFSSSGHTEEIILIKSLKLSVASESSVKRFSVSIYESQIQTMTHVSCGLCDATCSGTLWSRRCNVDGAVSLEWQSPYTKVQTQASL